MRFGQAERELPSGEFACDIRPEGFTTAEAARIFAVREHARMASLSFGIPPWRIYGTIWVESRFRPYARSSAGAQGLMQLMPRTWKALSAQTGGRNVFDPYDNIQAGSAFLAALYQNARNVMHTTGYPEKKAAIIRGFGREPTAWEVAHAGYFAGQRGAREMEPGSAKQKKVMRYVAAVERAAARFKALEPFCDGKPAWDAPAPHKVPVARRTKGKTPAPVQTPVKTPASAPAPVAAGGAGVALLLLLLLAAIGGGL